jgi:hypothetical protein
VFVESNHASRIDPFTNIVSGGDSTLFGEFHGLSINAGLRGGQVYFAEKDNGEIIGVAVWFGPEEAHPLDRFVFMRHNSTCTSN